MRGLGPFLKDAWHLTRPYFLTSEERWSARGLLLAIVAMNLTLVGLSVVLSFWHREFYNALQDKDGKAFLELLFLYRPTPSGLMPGFCEVAVVYIVLYVYSVYLNQMLQIRWRAWMTRKFLHRMAGGPRLLPHQPDAGPAARSARTTRISAWPRICVISPRRP